MRRLGLALLGIVLGGSVLAQPPQPLPNETQPLLPPERLLNAMGLMYLPDDPSPPPPDTPVTIRVLWVRTIGTSEATCAATAARVNEINTNSLVGHVTIQMVGCGLLAQPSSGSLQTDLSRLYLPADGWYDEAHLWRNTLYADQIQILIPSDSGGAAGLGYITSTAISAMSAVVEQYAVGYMSGPHELGHNWGLHHNRENASSQGATPYAYGWRAGTWRTVMAYAPGERIPYWSNPRQTCPGSLPCGTPTDDNARVTAERAGIVAQFRGDPPTTLQPPTNHRGTL